MATETRHLFELPEQWESTVLGNVAEFINGDRGKNYPAQSDRVEHGVPFINTGHIDPNGRLSHRRMDFISRDRFDKLGSGKVRPGDIVYCLRGSTIGKAARNDYREGVIASSLVIIRAKPSANQDFLYYFLISPAGQKLAKERDNGSAQPNLSASSLSNYPLLLPPLPEQQAIADMLSTIDDKIELNRRMSETLEAIAGAMFKSWFVDFDPVRAKMNGEPPASICQRFGLTPDHLALFPDHLVETAIGEIPADWELAPLDGIANYLNGLALQKFPPESESEWLPVIKIAQLKKGDTNRADRASHNLRPEYIVNDGDVLFSWSGSLEVDVWCGGPGALNQHLFKVTSTSHPKWFYLYWTKHHLAHFQGIAAGKAVTMGHIQRKHLTQALCAVPPKPLMDALTGIMAPMLDKQIENRKESRALAMVRDELLPKLLSGELRATEIAHKSEEAA